jgi:hypothetical protein
MSAELPSSSSESALLFHLRCLARSWEADIHRPTPPRTYRKQRLSTSRYLRLLRFYAPDRDSHDLDIELEAASRAYIDWLNNTLGPATNRLHIACVIFRSFITNHEPQYPEPLLVQLARDGLRIATFLNEHLTTLMFVDEKQLRTVKVLYLQYKMMRAMGVPLNLDRRETTFEVCTRVVLYSFVLSIL